MRPLTTLIRRFAADESGVFAVLFGIMAIVLLALGGAAVDFVSLQQARTQAQMALDAAALALQPSIRSKSSEIIRLEAEALVRERLINGVAEARVDRAVVDLDDGSLLLEARLSVPTNFIRLVGVSQMGASVLAEATRKQLYLEVAMVLDNSGSMDDNFQRRNQKRMTHLTSAAKNATEILFADSDPVNPRVKVGIVPFTQFVNVGTQYATASWVNRGGDSAIGRDNFDNDDNPTTPFTANFDRLALFDGLRNASWGGCFEARKTPYDTNVAAPNPGNPDTLFVPLFVPDEPDTSGFSNSYLSDTGGSCSTMPSCTNTIRYNSCSQDRRGNWSCSGVNSNQWTYRAPNGTTTTTGTSCLNQLGGEWASTSDTINGSTRTRTVAYTNNRVRQERLCKYANVSIGSVSRSYASGPNADCPIHPLTPLTDNEQTVLDSIEAMRPRGPSTNQPEGGTNIAQGAIWGFHLLAPGEPIAGARDYNEATSKVMILMTDGDNTMSSSGNMNASRYSAYGYVYNNTARPDAGRIGQIGWSANNLRNEMDNRLLATCANAKAAGIVIYTIGLYSTTESTIQMLKDCSSGSDYWYFPTEASELNDVFEAIARQLSQLRLSL